MAVSLRLDVFSGTHRAHTQRPRRIRRLRSGFVRASMQLLALEAHARFAHHACMGGTVLSHLVSATSLGRFLRQGGRRCPQCTTGLALYRGIQRIEAIVAQLSGQTYSVSTGEKSKQKLLGSSLSQREEIVPLLRDRTDRTFILTPPSGAPMVFDEEGFCLSCNYFIEPLSSIQQALLTGRTLSTDQGESIVFSGCTLASILTSPLASLAHHLLLPPTHHLPNLGAGALTFVTPWRALSLAQRKLIAVARGDFQRNDVGEYLLSKEAADYAASHALIPTPRSRSSRRETEQRVRLSTIPHGVFSVRTIPPGLQPTSAIELATSSTPLGRFLGADKILAARFAATKESRIEGFSAVDFILSQRGQCSRCHGRGLDEDGIRCDECHGSCWRYEVLSIKVEGLSIAETWSFSVEKLSETFTFPKGWARVVAQAKESGASTFPLTTPLRDLPLATQVNFLVPATTVELLVVRSCDGDVASASATALIKALRARAKTTLVETHHAALTDASDGLLTLEG